MTTNRKICRIQARPSSVVTEFRNPLVLNGEHFCNLYFVGVAVHFLVGLQKKRAGYEGFNDIVSCLWAGKEHVSTVLQYNVHMLHF